MKAIDITDQNRLFFTYIVDIFMTRQYLNEAHKKYSEACQKEVEEMAEDPLTYEQFLEQIAEQNRESELGGYNPDSVPYFESGTISIGQIPPEILG